MTVQILPASEEDAEDLARMVVLCNADDKIFNHIVARERNATPAQKAEHIRWRSERNRWNMRKKGSYYFKAVDTLTKSSVGFAAIISPENEKSAWPGGPSDTVDQEYFMEYVQAVERKKKDLLGDADNIWRESRLDLCVTALAVQLTASRCARYGCAPRVSRSWYRE